MASLDKTAVEVINGVCEFLTRLGKVTGDTTMPVQQVLTLAAVAVNPNVNMLDLPKFSGVERSANSRNVAKLGPGLRPTQPGLGLIEAYEDPYDRRFKKVRLTPRGEALLSEVARASLPVIRRVC